jgi:hypothetical protein
MSHPERSLLAWVILGLLGALVVTNVALLILLWTGGPLIGLGFYLALLALGLRARQRDHRLMMVGGLLGLAVHVVEVATMGWSDYPTLVALNLALPAALALSAWAEDQRLQVAGDR